MYQNWGEVQAGRNTRARCGTGGKRAVGGGLLKRHFREGLSAGDRGEGTHPGTHMKHVLHGCDAGRVEAQRLVEVLRALPTRKVGIRAGARCEPGGERAVRGGDGSSGIQGRALGWRGRGEGTHLKHGLHGCDLGRVESQRLVEGTRGLCRVARWAYVPRGVGARRVPREVRGQWAGATAQAALQGSSRLVWRSGRGHAHETCPPCL